MCPSLKRCGPCSELPAHPTPLDLVNKHGKTLSASQTTQTLTPPLTLDERYQGSSPPLGPSALPRHSTLSVEDASPGACHCPPLCHVTRRGASRTLSPLSSALPRWSGPSGCRWSRAGRWLGRCTQKRRWSRLRVVWLPTWLSIYGNVT